MNISVLRGSEAQNPDSWLPGSDRHPLPTTLNTEMNRSQFSGPAPKLLLSESLPKVTCAPPEPPFRQQRHLLVRDGHGPVLGHTVRCSRRTGHIFLVSGPPPWGPLRLGTSCGCRSPSASFQSCPVEQRLRKEAGLPTHLLLDEHLQYGLKGGGVAEVGRVGPAPGDSITRTPLTLNRVVLRAQKPDSPAAGRHRWARSPGVRLYHIQ
ncbi:uncharacterized protein LOC128778894 [Panthera pardus]|uniref:Uncharacterized protein LOC128778894 n=1 Tax=Panthera pardus TaxID=9691 RepID=A0A9W2W3T5_PANPR|nr:uncharacterized protein LOC128778894 [Panthera pardus]